MIGTFDEPQGSLVRLKGYVFDDTQFRIDAARLQCAIWNWRTSCSNALASCGRSTATLRPIPNSAFDAIITIDSRGSIQTVNWAAEKLFGYSAAEMIGHNVSILMPSPYREEHNDYIQRYLTQ